MDRGLAPRTQGDNPRSNDPCTARRTLWSDLVRYPRGTQRWHATFGGRRGPGRRGEDKQWQKHNDGAATAGGVGDGAAGAIDDDTTWSTAAGYSGKPGNSCGPADNLLAAGKTHHLAGNDPVHMEVAEYLLVRQFMSDITTPATQVLEMVLPPAGVRVGPTEPYVYQVRGEARLDHTSQRNIDCALIGAQTTATTTPVRPSSNSDSSDRSNISDSGNSPAVKRHSSPGIHVHSPCNLR